jgi:hypothetical protein
VKISQILALIAQFPAGATAGELARRAYDNPDGCKVRSFAGVLGRLAARGALRKQGRLYFPNGNEQLQSAAPQWPAGWYATPHGPRWWDGARWW